MTRKWYILNYLSLLQVEANDPGAAKLAERLSDLSAQCDDDGGSSQYDDQNGSLF
ncbi:unnamed protein product [Heligmosomoides polygyrus]|uniref:Uncharacterized protein n=1 Tax=Heligmosomoides polygyrus TaxID=6339 RepID=A0A183GI76_HELPZ|nr:unnamed protein product [Heligmosomoides polygyrus]